MRWLFSAVFIAVWTFADVLLNEAALRQALAELILREAQSIGAPVRLDQSVDGSWRFFLLSAPFAALAVVVAVTAVLWLYGLHVVFFMGYITIEQPLMYLMVNAGLAFIKYSECARPPAPAPG